MSRVALVTAAELTSLSRRTFTAAEQTTIAGLITNVEAYVAAFCLDWESENAGAYHDYDGSGTSWLWLRRYVASVTAIADDGAALTTSDFRVKGHYLRYKDGNTFNEGDENIRVTGTWGWSTAAAAPVDFKEMVRLICLDALTAYFDREEASVSIGGVSQTFIQGVITRNALIQSIWDKYAGPSAW